MTDTAAPPVEADPNVPVFGRRTTPLAARKYRTFAVEVETDRERWDEHFDAYFDPDAGAILGVMNARTDVQQAHATATLLRTSLRDDDGVPADWRFPDGPVVDDEGRVVYFVVAHGALNADDGDPVEVEVEYDDDGEPVDVPPGAEPRYEWHDGELLTATELREAIAEYDVLDDGSSRRRFEWIMNSPRHRVQLEALTELGKWITGEVVARPTQKPTRSGRGRSSGGRTSKASSRGRR